MKILICLAMSCGLTAILYLYLKQRLSMIETRLNTLTDLAQTLASELYQKEKQQLGQEPRPELVDESSESESEDETDSDDESDSDSKSEEYEVISDIHLNEVNLEQTKQIPLNETIELEVDPIVVFKKDEIVNEPNVTLIEVSDDESSVKQVTVDSEFSQLSLKDLKQKVNDLGGPPLKTKQALINFLKKKV